MYIYIYIYIYVYIYMCIKTGTNLSGTNLSRYKPCRKRLVQCFLLSGTASI